jgi:hypothetical protein
MEGGSLHAMARARMTRECHVRICKGLGVKNRRNQQVARPKARKGLARNAGNGHFSPRKSMVFSATSSYTTSCAR